jgi:hypothetical protein
MPLVRSDEKADKEMEVKKRAWTTIRKEHVRGGFWKRKMRIC